MVPACESAPDHHCIVPNLRLCTGDDADRLVLALQDRPLLDMQLEIGIRREGGGRRIAAVADVVQRRADRDPLGIGQGVGVIDAEHPGPDPDPIRL